MLVKLPYIYVSALLKSPLGSVGSYGVLALVVMSLVVFVVAGRVVGLVAETQNTYL